MIKLANLFTLFLIHSLGFSLDCECQDVGEIQMYNFSNQNRNTLLEHGQKEFNDKEYFVNGYVSGTVKRTFFSLNARNPNEQCKSGSLHYKLIKAEFDLPPGFDIVDVDSPHSTQENIIYFSPESYLGKYHVGSKVDGVFFYIKVKPIMHGAFYIPVTLTYSKLVCNMNGIGLQEKIVNMNSKLLLGEVILSERLNRRNRK